jgi:HJR/Mrr/RecB family endonuclease
MARRRKRDDDWIGLVAQLAGAVILLSLISPLVRQTISAVGFIAVCSLAIAIVGLIGFGVYRWVARSNRPASSDNAFHSSTADANPPSVNLPRIAVPAQNKGSTPQSTADLLEQMRSIDWFQFEKLVGLAYRKLGYTVTRRGGANPDGGIDLVIEKDAQRSAVQCKQWKTWNVGVKSVREFLGALTDGGIQKGIFITLCGYTGEAKKLAEKHGIEIVNETGLAHMLESTDARFDSEVLAILRHKCKFCPKCESEMVRRTATKGPGAGKQFWGCSTYPRCRCTMPVT